MPHDDRHQAEIAHEQSYLDLLHEHLDLLRARDPADRDRLDAVGHGLCFGRLDGPGGTLYIGRIGLFDGDDPLLVDWRAPAARPFYTATAAAPEGVRRRRRITTRGRTVVAVDDELLDGLDGDGLAGDAALLAAVTAGRGERMADIVTTLRAEQDRIVRSEHPGVLVVEGGPGTGKTAVALHRVAYLLYRHRHLLARGVLVVGPSPVFLDYIGQVLPGLGEDHVVTATVADLVPGVVPVPDESAEDAEAKGDARVTDLLAAAVRDRVTIPDGSCEVRFEGHVVRLGAARVRQAADRAWRSGLPHNQARLVFEREVVEALARLLAERMEHVLLTDSGEALDGGAADGSLSAADLRALAAAGVVVDPDDTGPRPLLSEDDLADLRAGLLADRGVRALVAAWWPVLTPEEVVGGLFPPRRGWTLSDVPLLDEAAALLGTGRRDGGGTVAERAAADRTWTYGHVVVDEAQELSAMAWRMVMRRCPSRSMTVVGDLAQTGSPAGATSWADVLGPHVGDRWRCERLTVNYRTPAEMMAAAAAVLPGITPPTSVRSAPTPPWRVRADDVPAAVAELVARQEGRIAVIAPEPLDVPAPVFTPTEAKGLEFDVVIVVDPARVLAAPRGRNDLYVAMTRATRLLVVVHPGPPPAEIAALPLAPGR
ncbi:UvrD-helicase domain-containing protein [Actinosynnema sp. NPDC047251]|uniref:Helicase n=1 Tax=Saccharothrix espanaensis (strain ATCC 51144 / DSM 44229 / JCM 9112 / NBRC 15066 / NRRL 15764) TaxID=1179773 RepID=K0K226_SACES|nr:UvrD-helicase domain-containing protein [Saccharothrix espanaensis]CCH31597.1 Helicase [Saccharothrix espanaensis DSM 44229]